MTNTEIHIQTLTCLRCGHKWVPRQADVRICPKCKSPYWNKPKKVKREVTNGRHYNRIPIRYPSRGVRLSPMDKAKRRDEEEELIRQQEQDAQAQESDTQNNRQEGHKETKPEVTPAKHRGWDAI